MYSHTVVSYCIDYRNGSQLLNSHNAGLQQTDHIPHKWNWSLDSSKHRIEHRKNKSDQQYFHQNCNKLIESKETMQLDHNRYYYTTPQSLTAQNTSNNLCLTRNRNRENDYFKNRVSQCSKDQCIYHSMFGHTQHVKRSDER